MQPIEMQGIWWLPETPNATSFGTLSCNEAGEASLSLVGGLSKAPFSFNASYPIILGEAHGERKEQKVTLRNCFLSKTSSFLGRIARREEFFAHRVFIGKHLATDQDFIFDAADVSFSRLAAWAAGLSGFSHQSGDFTISWSHPEPMSGRIPRATYILGVSVSTSMTRRKHELTEDVNIGLQFSQSQNDDEISTSIIYPLQNFFTFAADAPNALTSLTLSRKDQLLDDLTVIGPTVFSDGSAFEEIAPYKMLFTLADIRDRLESVINLWFDLSNRYADAVALFFGGIYRPAGYVDQRFSQIMQVMALYNTVKNPGKVDSLQFSRLAEDLVLRAADKEAARHFLNSHPLVSAERALVGLVEENQNLFAPLATDSEGRGLDRFIEYAMNTLTYSATRVKPAGMFANTGAELLWLNVRMAFLMKIALLRELQFTTDAITHLLNRNAMFRHVIDSIQPHAPWLLDRAS